MRQCPTPEGGPGHRPLIAHQITGCVCVERQREHYHKCYRCVFRGKPAEFVLADTNGVLRNGSVTPDRTGGLLRDGQIPKSPRRNSAPAERLPTPDTV